MKNPVAGLLALLIALLPDVCVATDFSAGLQAGSFSAPYRTRQPEYWVLPYVNITAGSFYIDGTEAGWILHQDDVRTLKAQVYYQDTHFSASRADTASLRKLSNRHSTMMAGLAYQHITPLGALSVAVSGDTLDNSNGLTANVSWLLLKTFGNLTIVPAAGVDWWDARQSRYYYGVSASESRKSTLPEWRPGASLIPFILVGMNYDWGNRWNTWAQLTGRFYSSEISDSPMTGRRTAAELVTGFSYSF